MKIEELVLNYRGFLVDAWPTMKAILAEWDWDSSPYFVDEWMQANWELLVERPLDIKLPPYGLDRSTKCRYIDPGVMPSHEILVTESGSIQPPRLRFLCFETNRDGVSRFEPPFDRVFVEDPKTTKRFSVQLPELRFDLRTIEQRS